jgi:hypothetical protein
MLKQGKYLRSRANGVIYPFSPADLTLPHMEVVFIGDDGKVIEDEPVGGPPPVDEPEPEPESTRSELVELYVKKYGRKPHPNMRIERLRQVVQQQE